MENFNYVLNLIGLKKALLVNKVFFVVSILLLCVFMISC